MIVLIYTLLTVALLLAQSYHHFKNVCIPFLPLWYAFGALDVYSFSNHYRS